MAALAGFTSWIRCPTSVWTVIGMLAIVLDGATRRRVDLGEVLLRPCSITTIKAPRVDALSVRIVGPASWYVAGRARSVATAELLFPPDIQWKVSRPGESSTRKPGQARLDRSQECREMATGTVKWFSNAKGYGFVAPDGGGGDVFVHFSVIDMDGYKTLKRGQKVQFELSQGPKGLHATGVTSCDSDTVGSSAATEETLE